jgi:type II secretory pathway pseudopilin PulG
VVLLEVLVALTILGIAGASITTLAVDAGRLVRHARQSEEDIRRASDLLDRVALWSREDLDRHLGDHAQGEWRMTVSRGATNLYLVELRDSTSATNLLTTVLYRPIGADAKDRDVVP